MCLFHKNTRFKLVCIICCVQRGTNIKFYLIQQKATSKSIDNNNKIKLFDSLKKKKKTKSGM